MMDYNYLNLPYEVTDSEGNTLTWTYTASGKKLSKQLNTKPKKTYLGDMEFVGGALQSMYHPQGQVYKNGSVNEWRWAVSDHLGNRRILMDDSNAILSESHYYSFGLEMMGTWNANASPVDNDFLYNGKEILTELNLGLMDYGARFYDPSIARFNSVDPLSDQRNSLSTYNYVQNNPIIRIDPDGQLDSLIIPNNQHQQQTLDDLAKISATPMGKQVIDRLMSSKNDYTIDGGAWNNGYSVLFREVNYTGDTEKVDDVESPSYVVLAHELFHAYDHENKGAMEHIGTSKRLGESRAVKFGNYIREIYGKGFRSRYSGLGTVVRYDRRYKTNGLKLDASQVRSGENTVLGKGYFSKTLKSLEVLYGNRRIR